MPPGYFVTILILVALSVVEQRKAILLQDRRLSSLRMFWLYMGCVIAISGQATAIAFFFFGAAAATFESNFVGNGTRRVLVCVCSGMAGYGLGLMYAGEAVSTAQALSASFAILAQIMVRYSQPFRDKMARGVVRATGARMALLAAYAICAYYVSRAFAVPMAVECVFLLRNVLLPGTMIAANEAYVPPPPPDAEWTDSVVRDFFRKREEAAPARNGQEAGP